MGKNKLFFKHLRKSKPSRSLQKQQLHDFEHRISMHLGNYLILIEEGTPTQVMQAKQHATSDLLKIGPDMEKIAQEMGGKIPLFVHEFLDSIDTILHSANGFIDEAKIAHCFNSTQKLEKAIQD
ncbi:MAG: hypothetical protein KGZ30_01865 [Anaplasmataceae bacterium]|nr:hypothetical protein [Anaplasmataceae bacterium]